MKEDDDERDITDYSELGGILFVKALAAILRNDEGIIVHHEGKGYAVYHNSAESTIAVMIDDEYLKSDPGTPIWVHYDGSDAPPDPDFDQIGPTAGSTIH